MDEFMNNGNLPEENGEPEVQAENTEFAPQETAPETEAVPVEPVQEPQAEPAQPVQNNANPYSYQQPYTQYSYNPYSQQPPVDNSKQKTNRKWRRVFCAVLAVAVIIAAVAIPVP